MRSRRRRRDFENVSMIRNHPYRLFQANIGRDEDDRSISRMGVVQGYVDVFDPNVVMKIKDDGTLSTHSIRSVWILVRPCECVQCVGETGAER